MAPSDLHLRVLGTASLSASEGAESTLLLGPGKALALITYLTLSPRRAASREHLVDLLWADAEPEGARRNLRQTIYQLRRLIGEQCLGGDNDHLTITCPIRCDRDDFLAAIDAGDLVRAADTYGGPFFPAFAAPGGAGFEHWADLERQRLHAAFLRALEALAREALARHRLRDAAALARRLRDAAPEREAGWRLLLEAEVAAGDWVQAAAEADRCEATLRDLGRAPEPATTAAWRAARQAPTVPGVRDTRLAVEMIGRDAEFAAIIAAWDAASRSRLRHVHVLGTAGIGKTRLLQDAAARIASIGGHVVQARANQGERDLPFAAAGDLVRRLAALPGAGGVAPATADVLVALDPALSARFPAARPRADDGDDALRLRTLAIADLLASVAEERPVALVIDDVHWADAASRQIVASLSARAATSRVLLLTSARPGAEGSASVRADETLTLRPLSAEQVQEVIASAGALSEGLRASGLVEALYAATGGSPMLLLSALQMALDSRRLVRDGETWSAPDLTALLQDLRSGSPLQRRLAALGQQERRVLLMLAVAGASLPADALTTDGSASSPALMALEAAGLIVRNDGRWECAHDLLAEQVAGLAGETEILAAHAWLGRISWSDPRPRARHLLRAGLEAELVRFFVEHVRQARRSGDRRPVSAIARELLGPGVPDTTHRALARAVPLRLRLPSHTLPAAVVLTCAVVGTAFYAWLSQPTRLALREAPRPGSAKSLYATVEVLDRLGRLSRRSGDTVVASDGTRILNRVAVHRGVATFDSILVFDPGPSGFGRIHFAMRGLSEVIADSVPIWWESSRIRVIAGNLNGQPVGVGSPPVRVATGALIRGEITLGYSTRAWEAAVLCVAVPIWGARERSTIPFTSLSPNATGASRVAPLELRAPAAPGRYRIVLAAGMETEAQYIASGTNWRLGRAIWNDGNDIRDWGAPEFEALRRNGGVYVNWAMARDPWRVRMWVPATVIEIEVTR